VLGVIKFSKSPQEPHRAEICEVFLTSEELSSFFAQGGDHFRLYIGATCDASVNLSA
jgi:hypothetical protein